MPRRKTLLGANRFRYAVGKGFFSSGTPSSRRQHQRPDSGDGPRTFRSRNRTLRPNAVARTFAMSEGVTVRARGRQSRCAIRLQRSTTHRSSAEEALSAATPRRRERSRDDRIVADLLVEPERDAAHRNIVCACSASRAGGDSWAPEVDGPTGTRRGRWGCTSRAGRGTLPPRRVLRCMPGGTNAEREHGHLKASARCRHTP